MKALGLFFCSCFISTFAVAATPANEDLSNLVGALNQVIAEKTAVAGTKESKPAITPPAQKVYQNLQNDLENCQTTKTHEPEVVTVEKDGVKVQFKKFDLTISGERCPLDVSVSLRATEQTDVNMNANFVMKIVFKTDAFIQKYKMKYIEASGVVQAKAEKVDTKVVVPVHITIASKGESTELGFVAQTIAFDMNVKVDLAQFSFEMLSEQNASMEYQGKTQKGYSRQKMTGFTQPEVFFSIDDKEVSQTEFQTFLQSFTLPGVISEDDNTAPDDKVNSQCQFVAYDKKSISADQLKSQLASGNLQPAGQLAKGQSCMKDLKVPFQNAQTNFGGEMTFGKDWISFGAVNKAAPESGAANVYVLYGDQAAQAVESETLVLGLKCSAVPACN